MSEPVITIQAGIAPYDDGSGYEMMVTIVQDTTEAVPTISFDAVFRMPISKWPAAIEAINRLLSALPPPPLPAQTEGKMIQSDIEQAAPWVRSPERGIS